MGVQVELKCAGGELTEAVQASINVYDTMDNPSFKITAQAGNLEPVDVITTDERYVMLYVPLSLAYAAPNATSLNVTLHLYAYDHGSLVGESSVVAPFTIPESVVPRIISVKTTDSTGIKDTYGGYIRHQSVIQIVTNAAGASGSTITSCKVVANGQTLYSTYMAGNYYSVTQAIRDTDTAPIEVTVTDSRGRTATTTTSVDVINYTAPLITKLNVRRSNADGTENPRGEHVHVSFSSSVYELNGKNSAAYLLEYKKSNEDAYTSVVLADYAGMYAVTGGTYIFAAHTESVYDVRVTAIDNFERMVRSTTASSAFTLMHWLANGLGMGLGKVAELDGVLDIGFRTRFYGGLLYPVLESYTDLNDVLELNTYAGQDVAGANYANCPVGSGSFTLEVMGAGSDDKNRTQRVTACIKGHATTFERSYVADENGVYSWGVWNCSSHPVNSMYFSTDPTDPASLFGGSWEQVTETFLFGASDIEEKEPTYAGGATGGSADAIVVKHSHNFKGTGGQIDGYDAGVLYRYNSSVTYSNPAWSYGSYGSSDGYVSIKEAGVDGAGKNMPPYTVMYFWHRYE